MQIATWNVNSLRVRLPHVLGWLAQSPVDVLAMQETKLVDPDFPRQELENAGYQVQFAGQKTYNGVALVSRWPLENIVCDIPDFEDASRRVLAATTNCVRVINLYVP